MRLDRQGKIEIQMDCGFWFPIQKEMAGFQLDCLVVWAIFDCDRVQSEVGQAYGGEAPEDSNEEENNQRHGTVFTFAAK